MELEAALGRAGGRIGAIGGNGGGGMAAIAHDFRGGSRINRTWPPWSSENYGQSGGASVRFCLYNVAAASHLAV